MRDLEEMLRHERDALLPPPPDVRYTQAAVRRRLAETPQKSGPFEDGLLLVSGIGIIIFLAVTALLARWAPLWSLAFPVGALFLCPLLLTRRESR